MFNYFRKNKFKTKSEFKREFFSNPYHEWIKADRYLSLSFEEFFDKCSLEQLNHFIKTCGDLNIITQNDAYSLVGTGQSYIILSHRLSKELRSFNPSTAHGELAGRIGELYAKQSSRVNDNLELKVIADDFVISLGLAKELESFLQIQDEDMDKRVRLVYLSSKVLTGDN